MIIDLRSDTVTKPTQLMLDAMMNAEVGDDVFGEDPTINELEEKAAHLFDMEAGLFCSSGTMTNQIAIKVHTDRGDEVICDRAAHMYNYEGGGIAYNSGCSVRLIHGDRGRFKPEDVVRNINPLDHHFANTSLVCIENTCNKGGGSIYSMEQMVVISEVCRENSLALHLDGARIFNALMEINIEPGKLGKLFNSISICLSKGLGAPVGSLILGSREFITSAHKIRKVIGGGMRQAGYLAAAGIYALDNHIDRLKEDHNRAKVLENTLNSLSFIEEVAPVQSNIVVFKLANTFTTESFLKRLASHNIKAVPFGVQMIRFVTHLDFDNEMLEEVVETLKTIN